MMVLSRSVGCAGRGQEIADRVSLEGPTKGRKKALVNNSSATLSIPTSDMLEICVVARSERQIGQLESGADFQEELLRIFGREKNLTNAMQLRLPEFLQRFPYTSSRRTPHTAY